MRSRSQLTTPSDRSRSASGFLTVLLCVVVLFASSGVTAQQPSDISSNPFTAIYEQYAQNIEQWRYAFEPHQNTPGAADLAQIILAPDGFIDFHAKAARAWADHLQNNSSTNLGDMSMLHNGVQGFNLAAMEIIHLMDLMLDPADFEPVDTARARIKIEALIFTCYFAPPGQDIDGCPLRRKVHVDAAHPLTHLSATYDDSSKLDLDFEVVNDGDDAAEMVYLRILLDHGQVISLHPSQGACRQELEHWVCDIGTLGVGGRVRYDAQVDIGLDPDLPITELTSAVLSVEAISPITELDADLAHGGIGWQATDCDERYRKAIESFSLGALDTAEEKAGEPVDGLPGKRLYEPDDAQPEANTLVAEVISNGGADDFIIDNAGGNFRRELETVLTLAAKVGMCDAAPAGMLDWVSKSRSDIEGRHREISQLRLRAEDHARARVMEIEVAMRAASDEMYEGGWYGVLEQSEIKASKWLANQLFKVMMKGFSATVLPAGVGFLSATLNTIQAIEGATDLIILAEARLAVPEILASIETLAYLEGLEQRYEDLMDAQDQILEEIQNLHDIECFCE